MQDLKDLLKDLKNLFKNAGGKIRIAAWVVFILGLVITLISAFQSGQVPDRWGMRSFSIWNFLLTLVIGTAGSFVSALVLYAFGDITEDVRRIAEAAEKTAAAVPVPAKETK